MTIQTFEQKIKQTIRTYKAFQEGKKKKKYHEITIDNYFDILIVDST